MFTRCLKLASGGPSAGVAVRATCARTFVCVGYVLVNCWVWRPMHRRWSLWALCLGQCAPCLVPLPISRRRVPCPSPVAMVCVLLAAMAVAHGKDGADAACCGCAASPVTEAEFKMFKQAMGEQGLTKSSVKDVRALCFAPPVCPPSPCVASTSSIAACTISASARRSNHPRAR